MPPKKREKDVEAQKNPRMDHIQADHELFLQAFEKPTQIYRFLRTRNLISPIFLNRTLSYMLERSKRTNKSRKIFKIDSFLEQKSKKSELSNIIQKAKYMNLTFLGFFDKNLETHPKTACVVETCLLKVSHKKRKDTSGQVFKVSFGTSDVQINPGNEVLKKVPAICIPTESFCLTNGSFVKSYILLLKVHFNQSDDGTEQRQAGAEPPAKKIKKSVGKSLDNFEKLYCSELTVYDKYNRCLLSDGDYEIGLNQFPTNIKSPKKHSSWENISDLDLTENMENLDFSKGPSLKFNLAWSETASQNFVDPPKPFSSENNNSLSENANSNLPDVPEKKNFQIIYQFVYNNNSRQQTEACEDLHCPWCSVDCIQLYSLLKHLKLCHPRFTFTYVPIQGGARIDVAINELYDGSYAGSPHELAAQPGSRFNGPLRRSPVTHVLVSRPNKRQTRLRRYSLSEFLGDEHLGEAPRPFVSGHSRLYHHTSTCLAVQPREMDNDSESELDPEWLQIKTKQMIDEFTDVNEGEKELMKMWNLHVMKHGYVGDCQIPLACVMFVKEHGAKLLLNNLYRNFLVHLCSLFDFGLISPVCFYGIIKKLQELVGETGEIRTALTQSRVAQMSHWTKVGNMRTPIPKTPQYSNRGPQSRRRTSEHPPSKKKLSLSLKKEENRSN